MYSNPRRKEISYACTRCFPSPKHRDAFRESSMIHARSQIKDLGSSVPCKRGCNQLNRRRSFFLFLASRCCSAGYLWRTGGGKELKEGRLLLPRRDYFFSLSLSLFLSPLFPRSPFTHERVKEEEEWEEDTIRYDTIRYRVGELKTETRFCGGRGEERKRSERKHRGLVIRASSRRGEYIAIIYINTVDAVTINSCSHEGIEWNIKFPGGSEPRGWDIEAASEASAIFFFFLSFLLSCLRG